MTQKEYYNKVIELFEQNLPDADTELKFTNNFELLVAVMLSAQCTDKRINIVTPPLFHAYPDAESMSRASVDEILSYIRTVSYPNSKAAHLSDMSKQLVTRFNGQVPTTFEELTSLPGVGRKTANVVTSHAFGRACIAVDTHVFCVSHRLGLVPSTCATPLATENYLTQRVPASKQLKFHFWLLEHGKRTCTHRKAHCEACFLAIVCKKKI
ncbi:MAG: endonuclease III [Prevotellaceae bacterium]|nr:endonuclease III [Prevotellaceae bacterium]